MSTKAMVPMISPDGQSGDIPSDRVPEALAAGFKGAVVMTSPDGQQGYVPHDRANDAIKAGFKVGQPNAQAEADKGANNPGFASALGSDLKGMAKGAATLALGVPGLAYQGVKQSLADYQSLKMTGKTVAQRDAEARAAAGHGTAYQVGAGVNEALGVNVKGMEQSADTGDVGGVLGHAAAVPTAIAIAGGMAKGVPKLAALSDSVPSLARAGGKFQDVMGAAKNNPVPMTDELSGALSRYQELVDRGGSRSVSVSKLLNRVTNPDAPPMTYGEARDFASNISRLSADEFMRLTPQMKQQVGAIRVALNNAVGQAAESVGKGAQYQSAMKEYAKAAQLKQLTSDAVDYGKKAIPYAGTAYGLKKLSDALGK